MGETVGTIVSIFGVIALIVGAVATTWTLTKNKGYEAQREALESWKANAEAKAEELKIERGKVDDLRTKLEQANARIAVLEGQVSKLEARPDLSVITAALAELRKDDDTGRAKAVAALSEKLDAQESRAQEYHKAEIALLQKISEHIDSLRGEK